MIRLLAVDIDGTLLDSRGRLPDAHRDALADAVDRNTLRLPAYSRVDVRANRTFTWDRKRLTLFMEAINLLNRSNVRYALPSVDRRTFKATDLFETMLPLVPSIGILLEF